MDMEELEVSFSADYKPVERKKVIPATWRLLRNAGKTDIQPGYDDLMKICRFIKKGAHDCEIMEAFGLNAETMQAIKDNRYSPVDGIKYSTLTKIQNEFLRHEKQIEMTLQALTELLDIVFIDPENRQDFMSKTKFKRFTVNKKIKRKRLLEDEIPEDDCDDDEGECCE